jgi:hypothetical protein
MQWFPLQKTKPRWQSIHPENKHAEAMAAKHPPTNRATTAAKLPPRSGPAHSQEQHLPERGANSLWRQSICQGSIDGQASVGKEDAPYNKASAASGGHHTLGSKAFAKEEASDTTTKHPSTKKAIAAKHPLQATPARSGAAGQPMR